MAEDSAARDSGADGGREGVVVGCQFGVVIPRGLQVDGRSAVCRRRKVQLEAMNRRSLGFARDDNSKLLKFNNFAK